MAVPDFQSFFKPLLEIAADGKEHSLKEAREENQQILDEIGRIETRKPPFIPFLKRSNVINKYLGIILSRLKLR
jgi:restriction endonuclease Mrr